MLIVPFDKMDPAKLPKRKMMIRTLGGNEDAISIPQVGLSIGTKEKNLVISEVFDNIKETLPDADVKEGDRVLNLNGEPCTSFKNFSKKYQKLAVGDNVVLVLSRDGKNQTVKFKKPEDKGGIRIIRKTIGN
jgi:S1-C subfamily serine protease